MSFIGWLEFVFFNLLQFVFSVHVQHIEKFSRDSKETDKNFVGIKNRAAKWYCIQDMTILKILPLS